MHSVLFWDGDHVGTYVMVNIMVCSFTAEEEKKEEKKEESEESDDDMGFGLFD